MSSTSLPPESPDCQAIEQLLLNPLYSNATWYHIAIVTMIFVLIVVLVHQCIRSRVAFHGNLWLLVCNLVIFYAINAIFWVSNLLRYKILLFTYTSSCELLTPIWLVVVLIAPLYFYLVANSAIHFAIMLERIRATLFVQNYEREGFRCGIFGVLIVWSISIIYTIAIVFTALADTQLFGKPMGLAVLTSRYNSDVIIYTYDVTLAVSLLTAVGDYWVVRHNKKLRNNVAKSNYSLSENYQLNENLLSMRIIFPLDISYALTFGLYMLGSVLLRYQREKLNMVEYVSYYYTLLTLPLLHSAITLLIYICFIRSVAKNRRRMRIEPLERSGQIYFKQLRQQWNHDTA